MRLTSRPVQQPCKFNSRELLSVQSRTTVRPPRMNKRSVYTHTKKTLEKLLHPLEHHTADSTATLAARLGNRWMEYQGIRNWDGLLDPLDETLRDEILRYGEFVAATYKSLDFDPSSPTYGTRRFSKASLFDQCDMPDTGYRITRNLRVTSGIKLPDWVERAPSWVSTQSSWIGYVAVCQDKKVISRLGRRDIVIALRGTVTCLEWLENVRATLTQLPTIDGTSTPPAMVESGFLSLYTSRSPTFPSLQEMVREEIWRLMQCYGDEPLSLTITGHSLGAALATLMAHDIKTTFRRSPLVTVISFGGPRVGDRAFQRQLEKQGARVLRIVNSDDVITKVPGFTLDDGRDGNNRDVQLGGYLPSWIRRRMARTPWMYAEVGRELRLCSRDSPYLKGIDVATRHDLKTYLHLVNGFVSSTCPFRARARTLLSRHLSPQQV